MQVYLITNRITGKQYVGQTISTTEKRWKQHLRASKRGKQYIAKTLLKYGSDNFSIETLHTCESQEEMNFVEIFYISLLGSKFPKGYNLTDGGENPPNVAGIKRSEETKIKMKKARAGRIISEETCRKISESKRGKSCSSSTKFKKGQPSRNKGLAIYFGDENPFYGKKHSEESKKKMSESHKKDWIKRKGINAIAQRNP